MTTQLPRPIEPGEIRVGDTIERRFAVDGCAITQRMTVARVEGNTAYSPGDYPMLLSDGELILIDRPVPTPAPAVGSRWRDLTGKCYVFTAAGWYASYTHAGTLIHPADDAVSGLTPIPDHGDGCSPWPRGADGEPRCDEQMDNLTCSRERDHDGFHAAYGSVGDAHPYLVWAGGERVASWSERGQANG